ncbi:MAG: hypothetical protein HDR28_06295 [Lachnospiraceae bacterium]|nr:hypothetical protein [Lachnospiraceae bacterium]
MKLINKIRLPCAKCPYKLGIVKTPVNPCPPCKLNDYQSYEWFQKQLAGEYQSIESIQNLEKGL